MRKYLLPLLVTGLVFIGADYLFSQQSGGPGVATSVSASAFPLLAPNGTPAAPSYSFSTASGGGMLFDNGPALVRAGLEAFVIDNTAATFTNGYTIGFSATGAGNVDTRIGRVSAKVIQVGNGDATGQINAAAYNGSAANLVRLGATTGIEFNTATATIGTCGTGAVTTGSRGSSGEATSTGSTSCAVNFGANFTNVPFCSVDDETTLAVRAFTVTASAITVTGLVAGDKFTWNCVGFY